MIDDPELFLLLTPLWLAALVVLAFGSRWRGLARPLWGGDEVDGIVVAHEQWTMPDGRACTGIVVDFTTADGRAGRLVEPPVRWERVPAVGSRVAISHRDDLTFTKRWSRRRQWLAWLATLASMPVVVVLLQLFPVLLSVVVVPHVAWLVLRRLRPPPEPTRHPVDLSFLPGARFDPRSAPVPTAPPEMPPPDPEPMSPQRSGDTSLPDLLHRHFFPVVSAAVVLTVASISGSRSADPYALGWHLGLAALLLAGVVVFETSLALRGGSVVTGRVVDHVHRRLSEGDVCWLEVIEFPTHRGSVTFVDSFGPRRQRSIGAPVTVSFRAGEPERARALQRSQSLFGTLLIAGSVGTGLFIAAETWLPVVIQVAVCYAGFMAIDAVKGSTGEAAGLEPA